MGSPLSSGTKLGRYEIRSQLGAGGMGEVYLARDTRLERNVALKVLPTDVAADRHRMSRFEQEAKAASALNHSNILTIYEIDQANSTYFIATEFIDGETLRQRMKSTQLKLDDVLDVAAQIAAALSAAHAASIIHRDIKPENVMLRRDGTVKVLDFGLAKLTEMPDSVDTEAPTSFKTDPGTVVGTAMYMSPEQASGSALDARTDTFSLGVVVYELVAGRLPFEGSTSREIMASLLNEREPQPLARYSSEVPVELERIVSKALRKNRDERYQTIKDLLLDLKTLKQQLEFERKLDRSIQPTSAGAAATNQRSSAGTMSESATRPTIPEHGFADNLLFKRNALIAVVALLLIVSVAGGYWFFTHSRNEAIGSIAVLPFVNASGNSELEYLSDGMTDSLINSLSQLPNLSVKARSSVFHYKGTDIDPQKLAADLSVQAILSGRVVQRGDDLTLYLSLDDRNGDHIWGEQYNRKSADLVSLQAEIAREVSHKLRARLSGADAQRLTKRYPANPEAFQLYLKGRYYLLKGTRPDLLTGISYFQKSIEIDPSYAIAYVGLADAYRSPTLEIRPTEVMPKAKAAALKAIELDDTFAEGHAVLGWVHFWYDWDWSSAESQFKRALELDENNADAHSYYAHLLSNTGRHAEALAEAKRARELEPLNSRINAFEGVVLIFAGQVDAGIDRLQKILELYPNQYGARNMLAAGYIQKKMFPEAAAEARKGIDVSPTASDAKSSLAYALAKEGKTAEARALVEDLVRSSNQRYVPAYSIANAFNGLGDREKALAWLERGFQEHDVRLIFLKVDPKWNNLRSEPRFQDLLRRVGLQ